MYEWIKFFHLGAGMFWLGGMSLMLWAVRPAAMQCLSGPDRLPFMAQVLGLFFMAVWVSIGVLLLSGGWMLSMADMKLAPKGWHAMSGLGLLMCLVFAHLWFAPYRRLKAAVAANDAASAARALGQIHPLVVTNFSLGWLAVAAVTVWR